MNYAGTFEFSHFRTDAHAGVDSGVDVKSHADAASGDAHTITVPDAYLLFSGDYKRAGLDLVLSKDGHHHVIHDYFKGHTRATLESPDGAQLTGDLVNALTGEVQIAQASGAAAAATVIGHVTKLAGSATAIRNGVSIQLNVGDNVNKGDVVQAGSDSSLGLTFIDGTVFGLSANARMVLNEMVYDPNGSSNSSLLSLVQGTITFVAGETAKHGDMRVDTPVATMGIRGTAVLVEIDFTVPGQGGAPPVKFSVLVEPGGHVGSYFLYSKNNPNQIIGQVNQSGQVTSVDGAGDTSITQAPPLTKAATDILSFVLPEIFQSQPSPNPRGTSPLGGSTPQNPVPGSSNPDPLKFDMPPDLSPGIPFTIPINLQGMAPGTPPIDVTITRFNAAPTVVVTPVVVTLPVNKNSFEIRDQVQITDPDSADVVTPYVPGTAHIISVTGPPNTPAGLDLKSLVILAPSTGHVTYDPSAFKFLGAGQTAVYTIGFDSQSGSDTVHETLTFTIDGVNDAPSVTAPLTSTVHQGDAVFSENLLAGASDPDAGETATLSLKNVHYAVDGGTASQTAPTGITLNGTTLNVDPTNPVFAHLAKGQTATIVVTYDITDAHGTTVSQSETIVITGTNDTPTVNAPLASGAHQGDATFTANLLAGATDPDDGETATLSVADVHYAVDGGTASQTAPAGISLTGATLQVDPTNVAFAHLAQGQTTTIVVSYNVTDTQGATTAQTETVVITGTNDTPTVTAPLTSDTQKGDGSYTVDLLSGATDPDDGETATLTVANVRYSVDQSPDSQTAPAGISLTGATLNVDPSHAAFAQLFEGQSTTIKVTYDVTDAHGATVTQTEIITINGAGNAPTDPVTAVWTGDGGTSDWTNPDNWTPHVPTAIDAASFTGSFSISLSDAIAIAGLTIAAGAVIDITTSDTPHTIDVTGTLNNLGDIVLHAGATLEVTGVVQNAGTITVDTLQPVGATLLIDGAVTLDGGGVVTLDGTADRIAEQAPGASLENVDNKIDGYGKIGNGHLTLINDAGGIIAATDFWHGITINTGLGTFTNHGLIVSASLFGGLEIKGDLINDGTLEAHIGILKVDGNVTGHGDAVIDSGILEFGGASDAAVQFTGNTSDLLLLDRGSHFTGTVTGFSFGDTIDLAGISARNVHLHTNCDGTTTVDYGTGSFTIDGDYARSGFIVTSDFHGGTAIVWTDQAPQISTSDVELSQHGHKTTIHGLSVSDSDAGRNETFTLTTDTKAGCIDVTSDSGRLSEINRDLQHGVSYHSDDGSTGMATVTVADRLGATDTVNFIFNTDPCPNKPVTLTGTAGKDVIFATTHTDTLTGGASADQFVFATALGNHTITDFTPGQDRIELDFAPSGTHAFQQWLACAAVQQGSDTLLHLDNADDTLLLKHVAVVDLHVSDFIVQASHHIA